MPELSIIIPVYNSEKYLEKCLESIRAQTFSDFEVICINDGSNDKSGEICDYYAAIDSRFVVFHQNNSGVFAARKKGIENATGKYIAFIDSDDYVDSDLYERMLSSVGSHDVLLCGLFFDKANKKIYPNLPFGSYASKDELKFFFSNMIITDEQQIGVDGHSPNKLFKTDIMKNVVLNINHNLYFREDNEMIFRYLLECKSIIISDICGYHYVYNANSITNTVHNDFMVNLTVYYESLMEVFSLSEYCDVLQSDFQLRMMKDIIDIPIKLGFNSEIRFIKYFCPFPETFEENKVILYGAGEIGKSYFRHLKKINALPFMWVDKNKYYNYEDFKISSVDEMLAVSFDYVVIAVKQQNLADSIRQELTQCGVPDEKILWKKPVEIY